MIKSILKTLSFSFVTFAAAAILSASEQGTAADRATASADSARVGCSTQADINQGWEEQQALLEKRLAEKEAEGLAVPGAIIVPPFETFAPYRTDVPAAVNAAKAVKSARRPAAGGAVRD